MPTDDITALTQLIGRLPGLGQRSARRVVLHLLKTKESTLLPLAKALHQAAESVKTCESCGNLDSISPCHICTNPKRDATLVCVVEEVGDLWAIERSGLYKGVYHVLGGTLSALDGRGPEELNLNSLIRKAGSGEIREIILATNATVDGQTTAHYITERLKGNDIRFSRIAYGVPMGGELDYLDDGTLHAALTARQPF